MAIEQQQNIKWICKYFDTLSNAELYQILWLRNEVFVVEQQCVFQDADFKDINCYHLLGMINDNLVVYARLLDQHIAYPNFISIGRVVCHPDYRKWGLGKLLMQQAIHHCYQLFGQWPIKIGAQLYLKKFYESFGFQQIGEVYDEDGINHIHMIKALA